MTPSLFARFSGFYFFYFASLGVFLPFWPLYLKFLGFSAVEIGQLVAIVMAVGIVAPNLWGWLADHTERRIWLIQLAALGGVAGTLGLQWVTSFYGMIPLLMLFSFFWYASLPLVEGITLTHLEHQTDRRYSYTRVRLWGSMGFVAACLALSTVLFNVDGDIWWLVPLSLFICHFGLWLTTLTLTSRPQKRSHPAHIALVNLLRHPAVLGLLAAFVLMQLSHGPFYTFFSIYLEGHGYPIQGLAVLWSVGVFGEILVFLFFSRYLAHHPARNLFALAFALAAIRWTVLGNFPEFWVVILLTQFLHAATYGLYHAVSVQLIHRLFPGRLQSRGQALYSSLNFGVGAALGSLLSGLVWDDLGSTVTFHAAAAIALTGMLIGWFAVRHATPLDR